MLQDLTLTVDINLEMTGRFHVQYIFSCLFRSEGGLVLSREILDGQVGCEDVHTCCGDIDRFCISLGGEGLAFHLGVIPESALQSFLAVGSDTVGSQMTLHYLIVGQIAAREIDELFLFGLDAVEDGNGVIRRAIIVTPHHRLVLSVGTNHGYLLSVLLQGQDIVIVLQQNNTLTGHLESHLG